MKSITTIAALRECRHQWRVQNAIVGFVPTMGNLHDGHLQLVKAAKQKCDIVVVSIFVNPMQFGQNEDLDNYPRTLDADKEKLASLDVDAVFLPAVEEMYPRGLAHQTFVEVPDISSELCGASRPGHFRGVATIVCKLFNMVEPDNAFFGEKDYQQLQVIKLMVQDLSMNIEVFGVPTQRESSGLAMSSRNGYLSDEEKNVATVIFSTMKQIQSDILGGRTDFEEIEKIYAEKLMKTGLRPDYLQIRQASNLNRATKDDQHLVILVAAYVGKTRLIDNLAFSK